VRHPVAKSGSLVLPQFIAFVLIPERSGVELLLIDAVTFPSRDWPMVLTAAGHRSCSGISTNAVNCRSRMLWNLRQDVVAQLVDIPFELNPKILRVTRH